MVQCAVALTAGDLLQGRYRVGAPLGHGGMGSVFEAREEPSGQELAVKQLRLDAPELLDTFRGEFALLSRMSEPRLLRVLDFGSERLRGELHHYYVAERVAGITLAERAKKRPSGEHWRVVADALRGLLALHEQGIAHGDFTPANILVDGDGKGVLIDLSCARPFGSVTSLAGTEGYIAPELLAGKPADARADLFAVGRTLDVVCGAGAPPQLARLIQRLQREDPTARPADCVEVLEALGVKAQRPRPRAHSTRLVGREAELSQFEAWLDTFVVGAPGPRLVNVVGGAGMGVSRLVRELTFRAQLRAGVLRGGPQHSLGWLVASALGLASPVTSRRALLSAADVLTQRDEPLLLVIEDVERLESDERELLASLARTLKTSGSLALLASSSAALQEDSVIQVACGALSESAVRAWVGPLLTDKRLRELMAESEGRPKRLVRALGSWSNERAGAAELGAERKLLASLGPAERAALLLAFVEDGPIALGDTRFDARCVAALLEQRWLERDGDLVVVSEAAARALRAGALPAAELREAHRTLAAKLREAGAGDGLQSARAVGHLVLGGELARAEAAFFEALPLLRLGPRRVATVLEPLLVASKRSELLLEAGALVLELGKPRLALRAAAVAGRHATPAMNQRAILLASDALVRLGRAARAERLLERLLERAERASPDERAEIMLRLSRVALQRGSYQVARTTAEAALELATSPGCVGPLSEVAGVASLYSGDAARAEHALDRALALLGDQARPRDRARIQSHRATVAFRLGRIEAALANYSAAVALAEEHDQDDLIATGLLNLGTAEQQAGLWGEALRHYERGATFANALGRVSTQLTLEYNRANLFAEIGAFERADDTLLRLERHAELARLAHFAPSIALVRAEMALARGDADGAERLLLAAERGLESSSQPRELFEVRLRRLDVELCRDEPHEAERKLKALATQPLAGAEDLALVLQQARAKVDAALGRASALALFEAARARAQRDGLLALEATLETELSRAAKRLGRLDYARQRAERARRLWDRIAADLPQAMSAVFWQHPRRAELLEQSRPVGVEASAGPEAEAYRRLLALNRRLNSSLSLERVLEYAVQAALDLTEAERGFLLLATGEPGQPAAKVAVARSSDPALPEGEGPSSSIVRRTLEREEPILTTDAQGDPRFAGQGSVHALRLKSVLSVPILSPSGTLGVLYVDCRVQRGRFSEAERGLLAAFADQLAIAISNARLHEQLARQSAELLQQKHAIEQLSRGQAREIERLKREVKTQRESLELRYDYSQIVGRGPAMRAVLERLDRIIDSEASVLVRGESGTGKELVARAIHWNGPRKSGPFLGINCAALPEALLESELFGHVRGAFTGADRDKQGLMQAAAGGTLFLDELGELSLAIQAKLLRVLQEREVRPIGSEKAVPLDVRLVAATHRDLERALAEGRFREDLYYRVAVVTVELPPLRERPEDLPALAQKILERLARDAGRKPPELGQDALRRLSAHPFPGNVRELENVLTRAFVLAPGSKLRAEDLDLGPRRAARPTARSRRDFEADERERILSALRASRWNVSVVARTLGIPRNTLYRKLARYGLSRAPEAGLVGVAPST